MTGREPPRVRLAALPTPLMRAHGLERALGGPPIWVKRDDLTGFALAGNKARKLEFAMGEAIERGCDVVVTGGGPRSNHCRGTAAAARVNGLDCVVVLYGEEPGESSNVALMRWLGAEVRFTGDRDRASVDPAVEEVGGQLEADGRSPYLVPRGGATPVGAYGYAVAARELAGQLDAAGVEPAIVLVATGSCGTQAGLLAGATAIGREWRIVGAAVSRPPEECRERLLEQARGCAGLLGSAPPAPELVEVVDARGAGYGVPSEEGRRAARLAADTEGLLLDRVFTAKAMGALLATIERGLSGPAVFVHTGGEIEAIEERSDAGDRGGSPPGGAG